MAPKRKRQTKTSATSRKRSKVAPGENSQHLHGEIDEDYEYKIRDIIDERRDAYLIDWEGDDPRTGEPFEPTWEPKENANAEAVASWRAAKQQKARASRKTAGPSPKKSPSAGLRKKGRPRKIIESSPVPEARREAEPLAQLESDRERERSPEITESQQTTVGAEQSSGPTSPLFLPAESPKIRADHLASRPEVVIPEPPSSYQQGAYDTFSSSQLFSGTAPEKRASPEPSQYLSDPLDSSKTTEDTTEGAAASNSPSQQLRTLPVDSDGQPATVVPDSQSQPGSSSFVPSTQTNSTRPNTELSTHVDELDLPIDQATEDRTIVSGPSRDSHPESSSLVPDSSIHPNNLPPPQVSDFTGTENEEQSNARDFVEGALQVSAPEAPRAEDAGPYQLPSIARADHTPQQTRSSSPEQRGHQSPSRPGKVLDDEQYHSRNTSLERQANRIPPDLGSSVHQTGDTGNVNGGEFLQKSKGPLESLASERTTQTSCSPNQHSASALPTSKQHSASILPAPSVADQYQEFQTASAAKGLASPQSQHHSNGDPPFYLETEGKSGEVQPTQGTSPGGIASNSIAHETSGAANRIQEHFNSSTQSESQYHAEGDSHNRPTGQPHQNNAVGNNTTLVEATADSPAAAFAGSQLTGQPVQPSSCSSSRPFLTQVGYSESRVNGHLLGNGSTSAIGPLSQPSSLQCLIQQSKNRASSLPLSQASPQSSPLPPAPSQYPPTFRESAPARPFTLSILPTTPARHTAMDSAPSQPQSIASFGAKLKAMKERNRANVEARTTGASSSKASVPAPDISSTPSSHPSAIPPRLLSPALRDARSPSAVPAVEPAPSITQEEMNTSERYETLLPRDKPSTDDSRANTGSAAKPTPVQGDLSAIANHRIVAIGLAGHQRDQYPQTIEYHKPVLDSFLASGSNSGPQHAEVEVVIERLHRVINHPDLDNVGTFTQYDVEPEQQANWDQKCSMKFCFLGCVVHRLQNENLHIVILVQPGRLSAILETFLKGLKIAHYRANAVRRSEHASTEGNLRVSIIPTSGEGSGVVVTHADLVIAFDHTFKGESRYLQGMRRDPIKVGQVSPLISLVVPYSVEHIERSLTTVAEEHRLRVMAGSLLRLQNRAGRLYDAQVKVDEAADRISQFLLANDSPSWPLTDVELLVGLESQADNETASSIDTVSEGASKSQASLKRPLNDVEMAATASSKRPRVGSPSQALETIDPSDIEIARVSDSVNQPSQGHAGAEEPSSDASTTEQKLRSLLEKAQADLQEYVKALSDLQFRHEEQRIELHSIRSERDAAVVTAQQAITRMTEQATAITALRTERAELKTQLEEANARLLNHDMPERAELEVIRAAAAQADVEKAKLRSQLTSAKDDLSYAQSMYQSASSAAQNMASTNSDLDLQVATLEKKASGEQAKLRQMGYDNFTKSLQNERKRLESLLKEKDIALKRKDEEIAKLKEAGRGRMNTRGTSVPRSPRLGSPMKMDMTRNIGSRQGSPVPGQLGARPHPHPLSRG